MEKVHVERAFESIQECWTPRIAGEANGQAIKLAKAEGEFVWHHHEADEVFLVTAGELRIEFRDDEDVTLHDGELLVVPRGVEHRPVAVGGEVRMVLFEPSETRNTGNVENERTHENLDRIG